MIAAVLFDLDGTLADSERQNAESVARALAASGLVLDDEERRFVVGHGWGDIYALLVARHRLELPLEELQRRALAERRALFARGGLAPLPGAVALVRRLEGRGLPLGLVSGSSRAEIADTLGLLGLADGFRVHVGAEDYPRGKPAPDGYLLAARGLGVAPAACLVIEDSTAGIHAARAAAMRCVAVRAGNFTGQDQSDADAVVDTLEEVTEALIARLGRDAAAPAGAAG